MADYSDSKRWDDAEAEAKRMRCKTCKHWGRDEVNYGSPERTIFPCRGMKSIEMLGCDSDCWFGTPPDFGCRDWEER